MKRCKNYIWHNADYTKAFLKIVTRKRKVRKLSQGEPTGKPGRLEA